MERLRKNTKTGQDRRHRSLSMKPEHPDKKEKKAHLATSAVS
jgi:hypothetical protein